MNETEFAKSHLKEHLSEILVSPISEGFWSIASSARELCERNRTPQLVLQTFQNILSKVPEWSEVTLTTEVDRIQTITKCSYLDDLLMGVFIAYMKSFASVHYRGGSSEIKIDFDRPSLSKFIHVLYIHSARKLWQQAYLFKTDGVSSEQRAKYRQEIETTIAKCLDEVIRSFLPWDIIAKKYFAEPAPAQEEESEDEDDTAKKSVSFGDDDSEDEEPPKLQLSDETTTLDIPELTEQEQPKPEEEEDPMKELERKAQETLVLNL